MERKGHTNVSFFIGKEVEHTPAYGMNTLFVVGLAEINDIDFHLIDHNAFIDPDKQVRHIFFGANHSYDPTSEQEHSKWENMIVHYLKQGYLCSLDIPLSQVEEFNDGSLNEYRNFIPQIRIPIPYIKLWNYNAMLKIDDKDFDATNPGVWTHSLHTLMDRGKFTDWSCYSQDLVLK